MNQLKFLMLILPAMLVSSMAFAQSGRGSKMEPEALAKRQTDEMTEQLALSEAQTTKVHEVNLKYANKMKAVREEADGDFSAARESMKAMREEKNEELKKYLTTEQAEKWETIQAERIEKRGKRGDRGGRGKSKS